MIGADVLTGIVEIVAAGAVLLAIWKFMDKAESELDAEKAKH